MNPLFKSLYDAVITNTNRPNLQAETINNIKAATMEYHGRGSFVRDVQEVVLTSTNGGTTDYLFSLPTHIKIRAILNVYPLRSDGLKGINLKPLGMFSQAPEPNYYKYNQSSLQIHTSQPAQMFALSMLTFPKVDEDNYNSWIAENYPHFITDLATAKILVLRDKNSQAQMYFSQVGAPTIHGSHVWTLLNENETIS